MSRCGVATDKNYRIKAMFSANFLRHNAISVHLFLFRHTRVFVGPRTVQRCYFVGIRIGKIDFLAFWRLLIFTYLSRCARLFPCIDLSVKPLICDVNEAHKDN